MKPNSRMKKPGHKLFNNNGSRVKRTKRRFIDKTIYPPYPQQIGWYPKKF